MDISYCIPFIIKAYLPLYQSAIRRKRMSKIFCKSDFIQILAISGLNGAFLRESLEIRF